jgi:hypothetical protein
MVSQMRLMDGKVMKSDEWGGGFGEGWVRFVIFVPHMGESDESDEK